MFSSNISCKRLLIVGVSLLASLIIGFVIGYFVNYCGGCSSPKNTRLAEESETKYHHNLVVESLRSDEIKKNLKYLTLKPHAAASPRNNELIWEINRRFTIYGFESRLHTYNVLLSFPEEGKINHAYIISDNGSIIYRSKGREDTLVPDENDTSALPPFSAYGPSGNATGDIVYVNYGRYEDFEELEKVYNTSCSGMIVLARYGKNFRGDKVRNAELRGAKGILLYNDPFDVGAVPESMLFPNGRWLSRDGVRSGTVRPLGNDILTPGYPAKEWAFREKIDDAKDALPSIIVQPISALDAMEYFRRMGGKRVSTTWSGALDIDYVLGPFKDPELKARIEVHNVNAVETITNVVGTIKGKAEPDRYVLMGNHIDAWTFGAVDPSSGTAVMLEVARALGEAIKKGWQPKRTIKLCGWDGEEHGIIGSTEWVEEYETELRDRAVAYINLDLAVSGNYSVYAGSSPMLQEFIFSIFNDVPDPHDPGMTVLQRSSKAIPDWKNRGKMKIFGLGAGSDYLGFYQTVGVASMDFGYMQIDLNRKYRTSLYPVYHSLHDTFYWMENFVDKEFKCHLTVAKITSLALLRLADSKKLPFNADRYVSLLSDKIGELKKNLEAKGSVAAGVSPVYLEHAVANFSYSVGQLKNIDIKGANALKMRQFNDEMMQLEKGFIYPYGLPGRPSIKHYLMAPSLHNTYGGSTFPAIEDLLWDIEKTGNWDAIKKQLTITAFIISSVAQKLETFTSLMSN